MTSGFDIALWLVVYLVQKMEISVVHAIWSGIGFVAVVGMGVVVFHKSRTWTKAAGLAATILGIVLLQRGAKVGADGGSDRSSGTKPPESAPTDSL